jgi:hypothetical protein
MCFLQDKFRRKAETEDYDAATHSINLLLPSQTKCTSTGLRPKINLTLEYDHPSRKRQ